MRGCHRLSQWRWRTVRFLWMWICVVVWVVSDVSKYRSPLETSGDCPTTELQMPDNRTHHCSLCCNKVTYRVWGYVSEWTVDVCYIRWQESLWSRQEPHTPRSVLHLRTFPTKSIKLSLFYCFRLYMRLCSRACHTPNPPHRSWFDCPNAIRRGL